LRESNYLCESNDRKGPSEKQISARKHSMARSPLFAWSATTIFVSVAYFEIGNQDPPTL